MAMRRTWRGGRRRRWCIPHYNSCQHSKTTKRQHYYYYYFTGLCLCCPVFFFFLRGRTCNISLLNYLVSEELHAKFRLYKCERRRIEGGEEPFWSVARRVDSCRSVEWMMDGRMDDDRTRALLTSFFFFFTSWRRVVVKGRRTTLFRHQKILTTSSSERRQRRPLSPWRGESEWKVVESSGVSEWVKVSEWRRRQREHNFNGAGGALSGEKEKSGEHRAYPGTLNPPSSPSLITTNKQTWLTFSIIILKPAA